MRRDRLVLAWNHIESGNERAHTRCEIIDQEQHFPNCEIALAEDYGKQDAEEMEDEQEEVVEGPAMVTCTSKLGRSHTSLWLVF